MVSPHDAENGVHAHEGRKKGGGANLTTASISQPCVLSSSCLAMLDRNFQRKAPAT
jgi:hypothetical protein